MVVICAPSFITASVRHELIRRPSTRTVQAPHWPWSQPFLVPVRPRWMRSASSSVVHGARVSLFATPLTWSVIVILAGAENFSPCLRAADDLAIGFKCNGADGDGPPMGLRLRPLSRQRNDGRRVPSMFTALPAAGVLVYRFLQSCQRNRPTFRCD